jgi:hypothetical protein
MRASEVRRLNLIRRRAAAVGTHNGADLLFLIRIVDQQQQVIDEVAAALARLQAAASRIPRDEEDSMRHPVLGLERARGELRRLERAAED